MSSSLPPILPKRLAPGSHLRIVSPASSLQLISSETRSVATERLNKMGFSLSFSTHSEEMDSLYSSSIRSRIEDLHEAFCDPSVDGILTTLGGYNSIQLLPYLDFSLLATHPKIFCGYSDITTLQHAILAQTGLVTFSGPHFSTFGCRLGIEEVVDSFQHTVTEARSHILQVPKVWSDDEWFKDQQNRHFLPHSGWATLQEGEAEGVLFGGNLSSLRLVQGTPYAPKIESAIWFIEECHPTSASHFMRQISSLLLAYPKPKGMLIGRFQQASRVSLEALQSAFLAIDALQGIPIIANVDFGHTLPLFTLPIGGQAKIYAHQNQIPHIEILACVRG